MKNVFYFILERENREKSTHGGAILLVKVQTEACNITKSNTPPWVFSTLFKLYNCTLFKLYVMRAFRDYRWKLTNVTTMFDMVLSTPLHLDR